MADNVCNVAQLLPLGETLSTNCREKGIDNQEN